jgi:hypothetical protein
MRKLALIATGWLLLGLVACSNPRAWYRIDDYPSFTMRPVVEFEQPIEKPTNGAPPRMIKFNQELNVGCSYCHVEADAVTADLTTAGSTSRLMMDLSDRFKVECSYCHDHSPLVSRLTREGKFAERDMRIAERRWTCASCHDVGFRVTKTSLR